MRAVDHRLRKLLELRTDTPAMLSALEAVADVHSNKPLAGERARRELRSEIEHRNLAVVHEFIEWVEVAVFIARVSPLEK